MPLVTFKALYILKSRKYFFTKIVIMPLSFKQKKQGTDMEKRIKMTTRKTNQTQSSYFKILKRDRWVLHTWFFFLLFYDTWTITIKHPNERFYTVWHKISKLIFKITITKTYCFNVSKNMLEFYWKAICTVAMHLFYE